MPSARLPGQPGHCGTIDRHCRVRRLACLLRIRAPGQFVAVVIGSLVSYVLLGAFVSVMLPGLFAAKEIAIPRRELWTERWPLAVARLTANAGLISDYIVVGMIISPATVATFSISQRLLISLGGLLVTIGNAAWAGLSELFVFDRAGFEQRVLELVRLSLGAGTTMIGIVALYNRNFVTLWVGSHYYGGALLTALTATQVVLLGYAGIFGPFITMQGDVNRVIAGVGYWCARKCDSERTARGEIGNVRGDAGGTSCRAAD